MNIQEMKDKILIQFYYDLCNEINELNGDDFSSFLMDVLASDLEEVIIELEKRNILIKNKKL